MAAFRDEADYPNPRGGYEPTIFDTPTSHPSAGPVADVGSTSAATGLAPSRNSLVEDEVVDAAFFTGLYVMTAARIELAFSGKDGSLREEPSDLLRAADMQARGRTYP